MTPAERTEAVLVGVLLLSLALVGLVLLLGLGCSLPPMAESLPGGVAGERRYDAPCFPAPRPRRAPGLRPGWTPPPRTARDDCLAFGDCDRSPPVGHGASHDRR